MIKILTIVYLFSFIFCDALAFKIKEDDRRNIEIFIGNKKTSIHKVFLDDEYGALKKSVKKDTIRISEHLREIKLHLRNEWRNEGSDEFGFTIYHEKVSDKHLMRYSDPFFKEGHIILHRTYDQLYNEWFDDTLAISQLTNKDGIYRIVFYDKTDKDSAKSVYELICEYNREIDLTKQHPIDLLNLLVGKWKISENSWEMNSLTSQGEGYDNSDQDTELGKVWEIDVKLSIDSLIIMGMSNNFSKLINLNFRNAGMVEQDSIFFVGYNNKVNLVNLNHNNDFNINHNNNFKTIYLSDYLYLSNDQSFEFNKRNEKRNQLIGDSFTHVSYINIKPKNQTLYFSDFPSEFELELGRITSNKPVTISYGDMNLWYIDFRRKYTLKR
jgi:hypothetical protein